MSYITAVGTAVPAYRLRQETTREFSRSLFGGAFKDIDRLMAVFDNACIEERYFSAPPEWFGTEHSLSEKNDLYVEKALELGEEAVRSCLRSAGLEAANVDHFIFVSSTGMATPSLDARLANILRMRRDIKRTPIWGLGCAGGAAGLSRAFEYTRALPGSRVLLLALELCALTFQRNDLSKSNLVATSLFGDGAAAVLVAGDEHGGAGPRIIANRSTLWYDSLDVMGWEIVDKGLKVVFSRDIPTIVRNTILPNIVEFLREHGLRVESIDHFVAHPGGARVLEAYQEALGISEERLNIPRKILRLYGNMSSPTVLFVLRELLDSETLRPAQYGLITALGPGFSSEMLLIRA